MARTAANFKELLWDLAVMEGLEPDRTQATGGLNANRLAELLLDFNRGYSAAYGWMNNTWEDAWTSDELTPTDGVITFAQLDDAQIFSLWSEDPRPYTANTSTAYAVPFKTSDSGLHVQTTEDTVYAFWLPACPRFVTTAYNAGTAYTAGQSVCATDGNVYRALQATTGNEPSASPTYWRALPVLSVLADAVLDLSMANYFQRTGERGSARDVTDIGEGRLEDIAANQFPRLQTWFWIRRN